MSTGFPLGFNGWQDLVQCYSITSYRSRYRMAYKEGEKQVSFYIDGEEKDQFNALCKTMGISLSNAMRNFMVNAIQEQSLGVSAATSDAPRTPARPSEKAVDNEVVKNILKRLDTVERSIPDYEVEELKKVRKEVLSGDFGSMRYRMGIIESQVQELGGSIAWTKG